MADTPIDAARAAAAKIAGDPAIGAINDLSEAMQKSFALLEGEQAAAKRQAQEQFTALDKKIDVTRTEMAVQGKVHADRINALDRRSAAIGLSGPRDIEGVCLAALADDERKEIASVAWSMPKTIRDRKDDLPLLSNPVGATAVAQWLLASYKIQKRRCSNKADEDKQYATMERIEKAFRELFPHDTAAAFVSTTDTLGGHWLPDPVAGELYRLITDNSVISSQATHVPMTTKTLDLPTEGSSSLAISWGTENTNITDSVPASNAINKVALTANRLNGFALSSIEELQDSPVSILSWVQTKLTELAGREIDRVVLEGLVGAAPLFAGLGTAAGVNAIATGANGDALTYLMLAQQVFKARERASRDNARWYCAPELMAQIVGLSDNTGQPVVQFGAVPNRFAASILGFPVEVHSVIKADRTYGTGTTLSNLYFGPPSQIVVGDRMGMSWDVSDQVGFQAAQVAMRLITRLGLGIAVPGAFSRHENIKT